MPKVIIRDEVPEETTWRFTGVIKDETHTAIPAASLTALTLTIYNKDASATIINSISAQNILNANQGTVDSSGNLAIVFDPDDMQMVDTGQDVETHVAFVVWTYDAGSKRGSLAIEHNVRNMEKTT